MRYKNIFGIAVAALMAMAGCNDAADERTPKRETLQACEMPLRFMAEHPGMSRVTATAFESGDRAGVFMTDAGVALEASGNRLNNELLTCEGADWTTARTLYWDEGEFDVFAYYPYDGELRVVDDVPFSVARNQHAMVDDAGMDGYEATREIRKLSTDVPILALTAYAYASDEERILNSGMNSYMSKPVNTLQLRKRVETLLRQAFVFL